MSRSISIRLAALPALICGAVCFLPLRLRGGQSGDTVTAVSAATSGDYARVRLADGSFQSESYAFGEGGFYRGRIKDPTIDDVSFMEVARTLAGPLSAQGFIPTRDPGKARLLIMVYWGMTSGTVDPRSENFFYSRFSGATPLAGGDKGLEMQPSIPTSSMTLDTFRRSSLDPDPNIPTRIEGDVIDLQNAVILGYDSELTPPAGYEITARRVERDDLIGEIEHNRYFVVLLAYDFQALWKQHVHKLLWEARFSIRQERNDFEKMMPVMAKYASQYFGQNTGGLLRRPLPEGNVEVGSPRTIAAAQERGGLPTDTTLIAGSNVLIGTSAGGQPGIASVPAELAEHISVYQREKTALQDALASVIRATAPGEETRLAIDAFNSQNAAQIVSLNRNAESIRSELASLAAASRRPATDQSVEDLLRQFSESIKASDFSESLFTHP
jgi:hypothetical protein